MILDALRAGREPLDIAADVSGRFDVDAQKSYRWVSFIAEDFETRRRRIAAVGIGLLWPGALLLSTGLVLSLFGVSWGGPPFWLLGLIVGLPLTIGGTVVALNAPRMVRDSL